METAAPATVAFVPSTDAARILRLTSPVTADSLRFEALALPAKSIYGAYPLGDLIADANEMLGGVADLPELVRRRFPVNEHFFERLRLLVEPLSTYVAESERLRTASATATAEAEIARLRLLEIRRRFAAYAETVGLPAEWFGLGHRRSDRLNLVVQRLSVVLAHAEASRHALPDPDSVEALIAEGNALVRKHTDVRVERNVTRSSATLTTDLVNRYETLLLEALQHGSRVGAAAFTDDPTREARYRLQHIYGETRSRPAATPSEGGTDAQEDVSTDAPTGGENVA